MKSENEKFRCETAIDGYVIKLERGFLNYVIFV